VVFKSKVVYLLISRMEAIRYPKQLLDCWFIGKTRREDLGNH